MSWVLKFTSDRNTFLVKTVTAIDHALRVDATVAKQMRRVHLQLTGSLAIDLQSNKY